MECSYLDNDTLWSLVKSMCVKKQHKKLKTPQIIWDEALDTNVNTGSFYWQISTFLLDFFTYQYSTSDISVPGAILGEHFDVES